MPDFSEPTHESPQPAPATRRKQHGSLRSSCNNAGTTRPDFGPTGDFGRGLWHFGAAFKGRRRDLCAQNDHRFNNSNHFSGTDEVVAVPKCRFRRRLQLIDSTRRSPAAMLSHNDVFLVRGYSPSGKNTLASRNLIVRPPTMIVEMIPSTSNG